MIRINIELAPLAAQHFEGGRQSEAAILISRQLEKCFKDSKCVDLESLCIVADKKVTRMFDIVKYYAIMFMYIATYVSLYLGVEFENRR